ncbi:MAG: T9SS type A sorting domain-containing protein, partial [Phaeodactylibacter sp.]|nr:T9SS type A sorting domain-containing protein [Phaeodactylibacter sp.]
APDNGTDAFLVEFTADGSLAWSYGLGSTATDEVVDLHSSSEGLLYVTGLFADEVDLDPGTSEWIATANGGRDIFLQKIDPIISHIENPRINAENRFLYPNPTDGLFYIRSSNEHIIKSLVIRNQLGQVVNVYAPQNGPVQQGRLTGPSGLYLVELYDQEGLLQTLKILKQ